MTAISALGLREIRRDRGVMHIPDRESELKMLQSYRDRLATELAEVEKELAQLARLNPVLADDFAGCAR